MDIDAVRSSTAYDSNELPELLSANPILTPANKNQVPAQVDDDETDKTVAPSVDSSIDSFSTFVARQEQKQQHLHVIQQNEPSFDVPEDCLQNVIQSDPPIYGITADQFARIEHLYASTPLPNDMLFPWLHGVDGKSYQQNLFFGVRRSLVPRYRGLTVVHADEACHQFARLVHSVLPNEIVSNKAFINNAEAEPSVNLRNFRIQVARYATVSDIVVYGHAADEVAVDIAQAQATLRQERLEYIQDVKRTAGKKAVENVNELIYRVFVIQDPFAVFEKKYPELVSFDSNGNSVNDFRFMEREREEMRAMSRATEITPNIWLGNTQDAPASVRDIDDDDDDDDDDDGDDYSDTDDNPNRFSVCIEAHDLADMPLPSTLTLARETLNELPPSEMPIEIIHLDVYATGVPVAQSAFDEFLDRLDHLLAFMEDLADHGRKILVHCSDGYSETSLLALSWLMYKFKIRLPEAYIKLHEMRNFFVYAADVPTLRRIEYHFLHSPHSLKRKREMSAREAGVNASHVSRLSVGGGDDLSTDGDMDEEEETSGRDKRTLHDDTYINGISNFATVPARAFDYMSISNEDIDETVPMHLFQAVPEVDPAEKAAFAWFYSPRFEGSFPSRVLPFLYLGNLNHATNPDMLKALGITHVISVGEHANLDSSEFQVLLLDNLYDDGIDSIRERIDQTVAFIDSARTQGMKCLVHCRVGVSRSATITICYVMVHLNYNIIKAYLYVRARRLSVIIQPNLKFMYEMLQLDQRLQGRTSVPWPVISKEIHLLNMSYRES